MPLPRAALYGMGEDCHVAVWPGNVRNTEDITRFIAREARSYVISVSSIMRRGDIPDDQTVIWTAMDRLMLLAFMKPRG